MMRPSTQLIKLLKPPSQVANALDWKKEVSTIATLHIGRDRIGMAIASHPEYGHVKKVEPLPLELVTCKETNQRVLAPSCVEQLRRICDNHQVGSFLVWWPLQKEGRAGAPCGKVLHTLESLLISSSSSEEEASCSASPILSKNRPVALWTGNQDKDQHEKYAEDEWGRSSVYSRCEYTKTIHRASQEQYCHPRGSSASAAETWEEFCKQYWPESLHRRKHQHNHSKAATAVESRIRSPTSSSSTTTTSKTTTDSPQRSSPIAGRGNMTLAA